MRGDQADLVLELMKLYGLNPQNTKYIMVTHADSDHVGGLSYLKRVTGAKIIAHAGEAEMIENPTKDEPAHRKGFAGARLGPFEPCMVDVKVQTDMPFQFGDLSLEFIMAPGHTAGSMCIYHKDTKSLFSGDAINGSGAPYKVPFVRIDLDMMLETYKKLNRYEVEWLLPGHGGVVHGGNQRMKFPDGSHYLPSTV
jgi:glyoxylase-like metal-dependent hydrolase (beta-lactamase superfamily II)